MAATHGAKQLILASGSVFRRQLLDRLQIDYDVDPADLDEGALSGESHPALALRLAHKKAAHVAKRHPGAWVLGSDQVASLGAQRLGKPGTVARATEQLRACSGRSVVFYTAVSLRHGDARWDYLDTTRVRFRTLSNTDIAHYLKHEDALKCAGSFKSEGLGITLTRAIDTQDPTALIGLPLIALAAALRERGLLA